MIFEKECRINERVIAGYGGNAVRYFYPEAVAYRRANTGRILAFKLGGAKPQLPAKRTLFELTEPPKRNFTKASVATGKGLFLGHCAPCHNGFLEKGRYSLLPDMMKMPLSVHENFNRIVMDGELNKAVIHLRQVI